MTTYSNSVTHPTALTAFAQQVQCDESTILKSTGDTLTRDGEVIMWWVDDDLYAMKGDIPYAGMWIRRVFELIGPPGNVIKSPMQTLIYNGRLMAPHEVIHLVGCKPLTQPETGIDSSESRSQWTGGSI